MPKNENIYYSIYKKYKIIDVRDIFFKSKEELEKSLDDLIQKFPDYSICYPTFTNKDKKEFNLVTKILRKLNFKLVYSKPVFKKIIENIDYTGELKYKNVESKGDRAKCFQLYNSALKNTNFPCDYLDSLNPKSYFDYIMNKNNKLNLMILHKNSLIGFVTIHVNKKRNFGYIGFITIKKEYRGKGLSHEILKIVENKLYKLGLKKWLESTDQFNQPMINSLIKYGFKRIRYLYGYVYNPRITFKKFMK